MSITSGVVSIEDGKKHAEEFGPARKVRVELHFDVPEGVKDGNIELDHASALAQAKVNELLGRKAEPPRAATPVNTSAAAVEQPKSDKPAGPKRAPKKPEEPKPLSDKEKMAAQAGLLPGHQVDLEEVLNEPTVTAADKEQPIADELDELLSAPTPEITDAALTDAIMKRNGELKAEGSTTSAVKIRQLVGSYGAEKPGFTAREIKQEHRGEFLAKLKALTKD